MERQMAPPDELHVAEEKLSDGNRATISEHALKQRRTFPWSKDRELNFNEQMADDDKAPSLNRAQRQKLTASATSGNAALASSDAELILRLRHCTWLQDRSYRLPPWLGAGDVRGYPMLIRASRREELMKACVGPAEGGMDQQRFLRNWAAIWFISKQLKTGPPSSGQLVAKCLTENDNTALHPQQGVRTSSEEADGNLNIENSQKLQQRLQRAKADMQRQHEVSQEELDAASMESHSPATQWEDVHHDVELAPCDAELKLRLRKCPWLQGRSYALPEWLDRTADVKGTPSNMNNDEKAVLRKSRFMTDGNDDVRRFFRNLEMIRQIALKLETGYPLPFELWTKDANNTDQAVLHPHRRVNWNPEQSCQYSVIDLTGPPDLPVEQTEQPSGRRATQRDAMVLPAPQRSPSSPPRTSEISTALSSNLPATGVNVSLVDRERAEKLKKTVLAPLYDRISKDGHEILRLRQEKESLKAEIESHNNELVQLTQSGNSTDPDDQIEIFEPRGTKRKVAPPSPMRLGDETNGNNDHTTDGHLIHLANKICKDLGELVPNETIHLCGLAAVKIMDDRPDVVLQLAHQKIHTWPYSKVPTCWRRLFEDASLAKAAQMLRIRAGVLEDEAPPKKRRLGSAAHRRSEGSDDWFGEVVKVLDIGLSLSGAPGRSATFEAVFQQLENHLPPEALSSITIQFNIAPPKPLDAIWSIARSKHTPTFEEFQYLLNTTTTPLIMPGVMQEWPASKRWHNPQYLHQLTLGGHRQVPVEIGKSYTDSDWSQQLMTYRQFFQSFLIPADPDNIGYLAQHDLFTQIPTLRSDITIPDYCYTTPPDPKGHVALTAGLKEAPQLQEPMLNAWLGPKGTQTSLHTDPYHNILCQVVGYKYIRLYPPSETEKVYPRGIDEKGISLENTSQVDVSRFVPVGNLVGNTYGIDDAVLREEKAKFPLFEQAEYLEEILAPGESLYIPLGWWHYVESLTTSYSVSFWWN